MEAPSWSLLNSLPPPVGPPALPLLLQQLPGAAPWQLEGWADSHAVQSLRAPCLPWVLEQGAHSAEDETAVCCPSAWQHHAALLSQFLGVGDGAKTSRGFGLEVSRGCTWVSVGTVACAQAPPGGSRHTQCWQDSVPHKLLGERHPFLHFAGGLTPFLATWASSERTSPGGQGPVTLICNGSLSLCAVRFHLTWGPLQGACPVGAPGGHTPAPLCALPTVPQAWVSRDGHTVSGVTTVCFSLVLETVAWAVVP